MSSSSSSSPPVQFLPPPPPPPTMPPSASSVTSSAALLAAYEHLSSFTRCDRCNRPFFSSSSSSSSSSVVQITADCDHLFCLDCDASSLAECPVCQVPTLPRKHMVNLTQLSSMLDLAEELRRDLVAVGLLSPPPPPSSEEGVGKETPSRLLKDKADEAFEEALRQCVEDTRRSTTTTTSGIGASSTATQRSQRTQRKREKRSLVTVSAKKTASKENCAKETLLRDSSGPRRSRSKSWKADEDEIDLPSPKLASPPPNKSFRRRDEETSNKQISMSRSVLKTSIANNNNNNNNINNNDNEASPSPATAQRLFSVRRKREIVKAKKKEVNENGETSLHVASRRGRLDKVEELLNGGAEPNTKDFAGLSPLFDACGRGFVDVVEKLLLAGAHPNTPCGKENDTPLHEAAFHGNLNMIDLLLSHGANPYLENVAGKTPYDMARREDVQTHIMKRLQTTETTGSVATTEAAAAAAAAAASPIAPLFLGSPLRRGAGPSSGRANIVISAAGTSPPGMIAAESPAGWSRAASKIPSSTVANTSEIVLVTTGIDSDDDVTNATLTKFSATFGARLVDSLNPRESHASSSTSTSTSASKFSTAVTHLVCSSVDAAGNVARTIKYLLALIGGLKPVTIDWISSSLRLGKLQPEELFLVRGSSKNPACEGPKKSLVSHFYNFPPLLAGVRVFLDETRRKFRQPGDKDQLAKMVETAGGVVLTKRPAWFDDGAGGGGGVLGAEVGVSDASDSVVTPFHAQRCTRVKRVSCYVVCEDGDCEEEGSHINGAFPRVPRRYPYVGVASKAWLLDCFDRYEIVDAPDFVDEELDRDDDDDSRVNESALETLRRRQAARVSRSKDDGSEYLMSL